MKSTSLLCSTIGGSPSLKCQRLSLVDLIKIFHPNLINHELVYYKKLQ